MRGFLAVAGLVLLAGPVLATGVGTNANVAPIHVYTGRLDPGEADGYPHASPIYRLCTGGFQLAGEGAMVNLVAFTTSDEDVVVLHTRDPTEDAWPAVVTTASGVPATASAATVDPVRWCPSFAIEVVRAAAPVHYVVVTCIALGPCPALWD